MTDKNARFDGYWGLQAIAQRMGCSVGHLRRLNDRMGFPMILLLNPSRRHPHNLSSKWIYYVSEQMISMWHWQMVKTQREMRKKHGGRWWAKTHGVI